VTETIFNPDGMIAFMARRRRELEAYAHGAIGADPPGKAIPFTPILRASPLCRCGGKMWPSGYCSRCGQFDPGWKP
jgi:hypothetical protein